MQSVTLYKLNTINETKEIHMSLFKKKKQPLPSEIQDNDEKTLTSATEQNKYAADILLDSCPAKQIITSLNDVLEATYPSCKQKVYEIDQAVLALIKENVIECKYYAMNNANDEFIKLHVNYRVATIKRLLEIRDKADMGEINADDTDLYRNIIQESKLFEEDAKLLQEISKLLGIMEIRIGPIKNPYYISPVPGLIKGTDNLMPTTKEEVISFDRQSLILLQKALKEGEYITDSFREYKERLQMRAVI